MTEHDLRKLMLLQNNLSAGILRVTLGMKELHNLGLDKIVPQLKDGLDAVKSLKLIHAAVDRLVAKEVKRLKRLAS